MRACAGKVFEAEDSRTRDGAEQPAPLFEMPPRLLPTIPTFGKATESDLAEANSRSGIA